MKIKTPVLRYRYENDCFASRNGEIFLCREDAKYALGLKKSRKYRLSIHTKKPKKKSRGFEYLAEQETFFRRGVEFEIHETTRLWLLEQLEMTENEAYDFDGQTIWVRVKEV
jgi:hypothetical protein